MLHDSMQWISPETARRLERLHWFKIPHRYAPAHHIALQLSLKDAALHSKNEALAREIDAALHKFIEDDCGLHWYQGPIPPVGGGGWGGGDEPRPILHEIAAELNLIAHGLNEGTLKRDLMTSVGVLLKKAGV